MGFMTGIEWCDHTFNPWIGCAKVPGSPACAFCYAENDSPARISRAGGLELWGEDAARRPKADSTFDEPLKWDRAAARDGVIRRVFSLSQGDIWECRNDLLSHRHRLFSLIRRSPNLEWLLLTKRPQNIRMILQDQIGFGTGLGDEETVNWIAGWAIGKYPPNVRLGVTIENQRWADERLSLLRAFGGPNFASAEPLFGYIKLGDHAEWLQWLIAGGESGDKARPSHPDWFRHLRDQCVGAGVPFLFKQWGEYAPLGDVSGLDPDHFYPGRDRHASVRSGVPMDGLTSMFRVGKKAAGRMLDGELWNQFPAFVAEGVAA